MIKTIDERAEDLADFAARTGRKTLINSLSGGVDSTLSGMISKNADVFSGNVVRAIALNLPCSHDKARQVDQSDAERVAEILDMPLVTVDLTSVWDTVAQLLTGAAIEMEKKSGLQADHGALDWAVNNLKPTLRMMAGGFFADAFKGLTIGTDNAVENFLGYFSIRGDGIADYQPIRDMVKGEVQEQVHTELVDGICIDDDEAAHSLAYRTPTPGLFDFKNHTDEGELGFSYSDADRFVVWVLMIEAKRSYLGQHFYLMDSSMTLVPDIWTKIDHEIAKLGATLPVSRSVAEMIVAQNQKTYFKRKRTDLEDTLRARGLI